MSVPWLKLTPEGVDCSKYPDSDICYGMGCIKDRNDYKCRAVISSDINDTNPVNPPSCYTAGDYGTSQVNCESSWRNCIWDTTLGKGVCRYKQPQELTQLEILTKNCGGYKLQHDCAKASECGVWNDTTKTCYPKGSTLGTPISTSVIKQATGYVLTKKDGSYVAVNRSEAGAGTEGGNIANVVLQKCGSIYNKDQCINVQNCVWDLPTSTCLEPTENKPAGTITGLESGCPLLTNKNMCFVTGCYWEGSEGTQTTGTCRAPTEFEKEFLKVTQFALNNEILYPIITAGTVELAHEKLFDSAEKLNSDKNRLWELLKFTVENVLKIETIPEDKKLIFQDLLAGIEELKPDLFETKDTSEDDDTEGGGGEEEPPEGDGLPPWAIGLIIGFVLLGLLLFYTWWSNRDSQSEPPQEGDWDLGSQYGGIPPPQGGIPPPEGDYY